VVEWWRNWIGKKIIIVVRYLIKLLLELKSHLKEKYQIFGVPFCILYGIWMI